MAMPSRNRAAHWVKIFTKYPVGSLYVTERCIFYTQCIMLQIIETLLGKSVFVDTSSDYIWKPDNSLEKESESLGKLPIISKYKMACFREDSFSQKLGLWNTCVFSVVSLKQVWGAGRELVQQLAALLFSATKGCWHRWLHLWLSIGPYVQLSCQ